MTEKIKPNNEEWIFKNVCQILEQNRVEFENYHLTYITSAKERLEKIANRFENLNLPQKIDRIPKIIELFCFCGGIPPKEGMIRVPREFKNASQNLDKLISNPETYYSNKESGKTYLICSIMKKIYSNLKSDK